MLKPLLEALSQKEKKEELSSHGIGYTNPLPSSITLHHDKNLFPFRNGTSTPFVLQSESSCLVCNFAADFF
jgi:hypothetical protein